MLSAHSLRYYSDSGAEEAGSATLLSITSHSFALFPPTFPNFLNDILFFLKASELVGEIDLTACHKVTEHLVQRNYGLQLHVSPTCDCHRKSNKTEVCFVLTMFHFLCNPFKMLKWPTFSISPRPPHLHRGCLGLL